MQSLNEQYKDPQILKSKNSGKINDSWFTILGLSLSIFLGFGGENRYYYPHNAPDLLILTFYILSHILIWILIVYTVRKTRKKYAEADQLLKRFLITSSICLGVFFCINIGTVSIVNYFKPNDELVINYKNIGQNIAKLVLGTWMIAGMYEALYQQYLLQETQKQKNELQRMQMQQQLDNLKGKVNPHFLFNSLNTLSSLIYSDSEKAEQFVEELSAVYRYLLKNNEDDLATLKEEVSFINSYLILVKIRFGEAIFSHIDIDEELDKHKLPAISLQLLIENAIKHNVVSKETPLHITISTEREKLVVKNNLQRKPQTLPSEKMGLNYIISKYALVNVKGVEIEDESDHFVVKLPLIRPAEQMNKMRIEAKNNLGVYE